MTELSPAAQAVAKAALYVSSCDPEDYPNQAQEIAPAVLWVIAEQFKMEKPLGGTDADEIVFAVHHAVRAQLLDIIDELKHLELPDS